MKYLKPYKIFESSTGEIKSIVSDILSDIKDDGFKYHITDAPDGYSFSVHIGKSSGTTIHTFKFSEIIPSLNELIAQLDGYYYDLKSVSYSVGTKSWFLSMDPTSGEIKGDTILSIKHPKDGKNMNNVPIMKSVCIQFIKL